MSCRPSPTTWTPRRCATPPGHLAATAGRAASPSSALVLVLAGLVAIAGYKWTQNQYYVANDGDQVVIYQGVEADLPGIRMHQVKEDSPYVLDDLPPYRARQVKDGISADSLADARAVISSLRTDVNCPPSPTPTPTPTPTKKATAKAGKKKPRPTASAKPSPTPTPSATSSPSASATHTPAVCLESP